MSELNTDTYQAVINVIVSKYSQFYLHDRPANRQRMRMGYIHDGRVNYIRELYLHDRPANRQRIKDGIYTRRSCELHKGILFTRPSCK